MRQHSTWAGLVLAAAGGMVAGGAGLLAGGGALGGPFAGTTLSALLLPALVCRARQERCRRGMSPRAHRLRLLLGVMCRTGAVAGGTAGAWLWLCREQVLSMPAWWDGSMLLFSLLAGESALLLLLGRARWSRATAAFIASLLIFAWLSSPLWLFPLCSRYPSIVQQLASVHPLFALGGAAGLENWTEMGLAYGLMNLNQDVPFAPPASIVPAAALHLALAAAAALLLLWGRRDGREPRRRELTPAGSRPSGA